MLRNTRRTSSRCRRPRHRCRFAPARPRRRPGSSWCKCRYSLAPPLWLIVPPPLASPVAPPAPPQVGEGYERYLPAPPRRSGRRRRRRSSRCPRRPANTGRPAGRGDFQRGRRAVACTTCPRLRLGERALDGAAQHHAVALRAQDRRNRPCTAPCRSSRPRRSRCRRSSPCRWWPARCSSRLTRRRRRTPTACYSRWFGLCWPRR